MQGLWSRVAQAQASCRCRICLHPPNTVTRRPTTAACRRKVTVADLFTACYTTILGTATVIDAHRKEARKKELDEKLEKTRAALNKLTIHEDPAQTTTAEQETWDAMTRRYDGRDGGTGSRSLDELLVELGDWASRSYPSRPPTWVQHQLNWVKVEAAIAAEERDSSIILRHPKDSEQMKRTTYMVEILVQELLWRSRYPPTTVSTEATEPTEGMEADRVLEEVQALRNQYPSYESPHENPQAATDGRNLLSESFRRIFNKATSGKDAVGKICHNLLLSSAAPNIHNYNVLVAGFNRIHRPDLAQAVVESYLDRVRWPATQQTIVCLLDHCRGTNDLSGFREIVARMRGAREDGLHFRIIQKSAIFNELGRSWVEKSAMIRNNSYVERAPRGNEVFDSLIRGWLHFRKVDVATMSFVACLRNGCLISVDTVHRLLTDCLSGLDQQAARAMLKSLGKHSENLEMLVEHIITEATTAMARRILDMFFALADLSALPYQPIVGTVWQGLQHMVVVLRNLHMSAQTNSGRSQSTASFSEFEKYGAGVTRKPKLDGDKAISVLSSTNRDKSSRVLPSLGAITLQAVSLEAKTKRIGAHAKAFIIKHKTGHDLDSLSSLPPIDSQGQKQEAPAVFYALQKIQLSNGIITTDALKAQLLANLPDQYIAKQLLDSGRWDNLGFNALISFYHKRQLYFIRSHAQPRSSRRRQIILIKESLVECENVLKAELFCRLGSKKQKRLRDFYRNWYEMPLAKLFEYHHRDLDHQQRMNTIRDRSTRATEKLHLVAQAQPVVSPMVQESDRPTKPQVNNTSVLHQAACKIITVVPAHERQLWSGGEVASASY